jgi:hypothetical protein
VVAGNVVDAVVMVVMGMWGNAFGSSAGIVLLILAMVETVVMEVMVDAVAVAATEGTVAISRSGS